MFFGIRQFLRYKYFDIVWGRHPLVDIPKIKFLGDLTLGASFFDICKYLTDKYFNTVWGYHPPIPGDPPKMRSPKINFLSDLTLGASFLMCVNI